MRQSARQCSATGLLSGRFGSFLVFFFFLFRGGEGGVWGDREGGGRFFIENPRGGRGRDGREGVCREFGGMGGGG